jgi:hypothetical protein
MGLASGSSRSKIINLIIRRSWFIDFIGVFAFIPKGNNVLFFIYYGVRYFWIFIAF